ncbi:MAG: hypothetical protein Q9159_000283 [Coniocarpon cinnabarinum]
MGAQTSAVHGSVKFIQKLFESGTFSDMTIDCNGTFFKVHKCIVSSQGGYFAPDKQGFAGGDNFLQIPDEDPSELEAVIKYLYSIPYSVPDGQESAAEFHAGVYARAKYFQLPELQELAKHNFEEVATAEGLTGAHLAFMAAKRVYDDENEEDMQNDRGLKDILVNVLNEHKTSSQISQTQQIALALLADSQLSG